MQDEISKMVKELQKELEVDMFYGGKRGYNQHKLKSFLAKLGIKSAREVSPSSLLHGAPLIMESLESVLKEVTFDMDKLKLWPKSK